MRQGMVSGIGHMNYLTNIQLNSIQDGIFKTLQTVGVVVKSSQMRKALIEFGCIAKGDDCIIMPKEVVENALKSCPKKVFGKALNPKNNIEFESGKRTYFLNACGMKTIDLKTLEVKEPTRKEFYDHLRVLDCLENVDIQNCFPYFGFAKVPECMRLIESAAAKFRVSSKVQIEGSVFDNYIFTNQMAQALDVDIFQIVNSAAPYTYFEETAKQIESFANANMPMHFAAGPTRGMTCPMTSAGAVIANNAETLAGIVMAQSIKAGSRVWVNSMIMTPDMQNGKVAFGDIGNSITDSIFCQSWKEFGIPCWSNAPAWTRSKEIDYQAGYEMAMALMTQALCGADAISFQGGLTAELCVHPAKAIIDDDVVGMVKRFMAGAKLDEESLAVDLIQQTGAMPGSFMMSDLTLENWKDECYVPKVASSCTYEDWLKTGKKSILHTAVEKMQQMLKNHPIEQITKSQEDSIEGILKDARNYYRKKGLITNQQWDEYQIDLNSPNYPFA